MKKKFLYIPLIIITCLIFVYILLVISNRRPVSGFNRNIEPYVIKIIHTRQLSHNLFGFAWKPTDNIWLIDYTFPLTLQTINSNLTNPKRIKITTPANFRRSFPHMYYDKFDSTIYITNKRGDIAKLSNTNPQNYNISNLSFDAFNIISPNSAIVRSFVNYKGQKGTELDKLILNNDRSEVRKKYLLPKQIDGIFCCDGSIHFDRAHSLFFYMYYHRGEFLCLDTNLNLIYKAKTIDTINFAKFKIAQYNTKIGEEKVISKNAIVSQQNLVNKYMTIDGDCIYIYSGLKGDNESLAISSINAAIDVYSLKDGKYLHSFYLPKFNGNSIGQFKVNGKTIVALYGNYLVTFGLNEKG